MQLVSINLFPFQFPPLIFCLFNYLCLFFIYYVAVVERRMKILNLNSQVGRPGQDRGCKWGMQASRGRLFLDPLPNAIQPIASQDAISENLPNTFQLYWIYIRFYWIVLFWITRTRVFSFLYSIYYRQEKDLIKLGRVHREGGRMHYIPAIPEQEFVNCITIKF